MAEKRQEVADSYVNSKDFQNAIEIFLKTVREVGDRETEAKVYCSLGNAYDSLGDFQKAIEYHERYLKISKEVGDRAGEREAYRSLFIAYHNLGDFQKAKEYRERCLKISKEVGDRTGEGITPYYFGTPITV